jgi:hypothetical protein
MEIPVEKPWACLLCFCLAASTASAQTSFGSIVGTVTDSSGAILSGVQVAFTNLATNTKLTTATNQAGIYEFVNAPPGEYKLEAELSGFKHFVRQPVTVQVQQTYRIDIQMDLGLLTETLEVTAEVPLLQSQTSSLGQVIAGRAVGEMPLNGRNVYNLMELVPSVVPQGTAGGTSVGMFSASLNNYQINGAFAGQSAVYLDGQPVNSGFWNYASFIPTQDSVAEFKVQTNNLGPEWGRFAGGVMNLTTKSGSNDIHGGAYEYLRNKVLNANTFFSNAAGIARPPFTQNQFGAYAGAPVFIPHVYNGRNKTFWFLSWEGFRLRYGQTYNDTVPTLAQRQGDFSNLRSSSGAMIPIYDPLSICGQFGNAACAVGSNGQPTYVRQPFPGNVIPQSRISPTAAKLTGFVWPAPTGPGAAFTNVNDFTTNASVGGNQNEVVTRIDQNINDKQRFFARYTYWTNLDLPPDPFRNGMCVAYCTIKFQTSAIDLNYIYAISPTLISDVHATFNRYTYDRTPVLSGFDLTSIGWPASFNLIPATLRTPPTLVVSGESDDLFSQQGPGSVILSQDNTWNFAGDLTKISGRHTLKGGLQFMVIGHSYFATNIASGLFSFDAGYTASSPLSGAGGFSFGSFLLGYPTSGSATEPAYPNGQQIYRAGYFGDTWQATNRLTFNLGLRYELDGPWSERFNRLTFWDLTDANPLAQATGLPLKGQVGFVNSNLRSSRNPWDLNTKQFAPRFGVAYRLTNNTVLRGGYGIFWIPELAIGSALQPSSDPANSASTTFVSTLNGGITPAGSLGNPFPNGLIQPLNPSVGLDGLNQVILNRGGVTDGTPHVRNGYMQQWNFDIQWQLPAGFFLDVAYAGAKGTHLGYTQVLNQLPNSYLGLGSALLQQVPNPFFGLIQSGPLSSSTVAARQLLLRFPQYATVTESGTAYATSSYQSFQLKLERHFRSGGTLLVAYTAAKLLTDTDTALSQTEGPTGGVASVQDWNNIKGSYSLSSQDVPQRFIVSYVLDLPVGPGKKFLSGTHGLASKLVSGWGVNGITIFQRGFPLKFTTSVNLTNSNGGGSRPSVVPGCTKSIPGAAEQRLSKWFNTACFVQPAAFSFGDESRTDSKLRMQGINSFDFAVFKTTQFGRGEKLGLQFRTEFFNLFNTPQFGPPGQAFGTAQFGVVSSQVNNPRLVQFGLKLLF